MDTKQAKQDFLKVYINNLGDISVTCRKINIGRDTYYKWIDKDKTFKADVEEAKQEIKDWGESQLKVVMQGIPIRDESTKKIVDYKVAPSTPAIIFFNKTQNKDRGYIERTETEEVAGIKIVVRNEKDGEIVERVAKTLKN